MKKLASVIDEIVATAANAQKTAADASLSVTNASPTIVSDLGLALSKTAAALREAEPEVSYEDLRNFIQKVRNA